MARFRGLFLVTVLTFLGWNAAPMFAAPSHGFMRVSLGTLGGKSCAATAVNGRMHAAGYSLTAAGAAHAFLYKDGKMGDLGTLGGATSYAADLNIADQVAGWSQTANGSVHAFRWDPTTGKMTDLNPTGALLSAALAINMQGEVVGAALLAGTTTPHAVLWRPGQAALDLGAGVALDINDVGQVVGLGRLANQTPFAFLWDKGQVKDLGTLGGTAAYATGINNLGHVVGQSQTATGESHAFVWSKGQKLDLNPTGSSRSYPLSINDAGQVVGLSTSVPAGTGFTITQALVTEVMTFGCVRLDPQGNLDSFNFEGSMTSEQHNINVIAAGVANAYLCNISPGEVTPGAFGNQAALMCPLGHIVPAADRVQQVIDGIDAWLGALPGTQTSDTTANLNAEIVRSHFGSARDALKEDKIGVAVNELKGARNTERFLLMLDPAAVEKAIEGLSTQ